MLNLCVLQGRLVHSPELRYTASNTPVCSFRIACQRPTSKDGESAADFIDCVAWRQTAEFVDRYFTKGQLVIVMGRLQQRKHTARDGTEKTVYEINCSSVYFSDSKRARDDEARPATAFTDIDVEDEDLPF